MEICFDVCKLVLASPGGLLTIAALQVGNNGHASLGLEHEIHLISRPLNRKESVPIEHVSIFPRGGR